MNVTNTASGTQFKPSCSLTPPVPSKPLARVAGQVKNIDEILSKINNHELKDRTGPHLTDDEITQALQPDAKVTQAMQLVRYQTKSFRLLGNIQALSLQSKNMNRSEEERARLCVSLEAAEKQLAEHEKNVGGGRGEASEITTLEKNKSVIENVGSQKQSSEINSRHVQVIDDLGRAMGEEMAKERECIVNAKSYADTLKLTVKGTKDHVKYLGLIRENNQLQAETSEKIEILHFRLSHLLNNPNDLS